MSIIYYSVGDASQVGQAPRRNQLVTTSGFPAITEPGYLNNSNIAGKQILPTDIFDVIYDYNVATATGGYSSFNVTFNAGNISLVQFPLPDVLSTVAIGDVPIFDNTEGKLKDSGAKLSNPSSAFFVMADGLVSTSDYPEFSDSNGTIADASISSSSIMLKNAVNTFTGNGQILGNKGTASTSGSVITLNNPSGVFTLEAISIDPGASLAVTFNNTFITPTSVIIYNYMGGTLAETTFTISSVSGTQTAALTIYNNSTIDFVTGNLILGFNIF